MKTCNASLTKMRKNKFAFLKSRKAFAKNKALHKYVDLCLRCLAYISGVIVLLIAFF